MEIAARFKVDEYTVPVININRSDMYDWRHQSTDTESLSPNQRDYAYVVLARVKQAYAINSLYYPNTEHPNEMSKAGLFAVSNSYSLTLRTQAPGKHSWTTSYSFSVTEDEPMVAGGPKALPM
ncbi:hypothetical protein J6590_041840 [Homalodisca vitripennis]|nr:hypothetical protein J6590_041840 [Homalodisca vitripennis]